MKTGLIIGFNEDFICNLRRITNTLGLNCNLYLEQGNNLGTKLDYLILNKHGDNDFICLQGNYCFINMDESFKKEINVSGSVITYGLGGKNTVTVSSIKEDNSGFVYCLQRYLKLDFEKILEPQEIPIIMHFENSKELYASMVGITMGLIEGLKCDLIKQMLNGIVLYK